MTTTGCDLVIVGAGPVGLATALFARVGADYVTHTRATLTALIDA